MGMGMETRIMGKVKDGDKFLSPCSSLAMTRVTCAIFTNKMRKF